MYSNSCNAIELCCQQAVTSSLTPCSFTSFHSFIHSLTQKDFSQYPQTQRIQKSHGMLRQQTVMRLLTAWGSLNVQFSTHSHSPTHPLTHLGRTLLSVPRLSFPSVSQPDCLIHSMFSCYACQTWCAQTSPSFLSCYFLDFPDSWVSSPMELGQIGTRYSSVTNSETQYVVKGKGKGACL